MLKNRYIKLFASVFLVMTALWVATPKVYIHALLKHDHSLIKIGTETNVAPQSNDDCDFEKYDKPAYFNIFKFISGFIPNRQHQSEKLLGKFPFIAEVSIDTTLLRGPPQG